MRILIATDAWAPQVNGVVSTLERMTQAAREWGAEFEFLTPQGMASAPLPTYPDLRVALPTPRAIAARFEAAKVDRVHIATEGPIGWLTRRYCLKRGLPFTTSYHTRFPEYVAARTRIPAAVIYAALRRFHAPSRAVMAATPSLSRELTSRGFARVRLWSRGVDHALFRPHEGGAFDLARPIFLSVGRVAVEKNLDAFLALDLPGSKVVVGDGPAKAELSRRFPGAHFVGAMRGEALARAYASADVFVFPSLTDTFGLVTIEALASGLPVAAFPVVGPLDVIAESGAGALNADLRQACLDALDIPRARAREHSLRFTWRESARQFLEGIEAAKP